jgi:uncharacterized protein YggE
MGKSAFLILCLFLPAQAQVTGTDRTVTITASRNATVAPDQGVFVVDVLTATDASLDDVLSAAPGFGLSAANLTSVYATTRYDPTGKTNVSHDYLDWSFSVTAPLTNLKTTIGQLAALQTAVASRNNGMSVSYSMRGTQTSAQALSGQNCQAADLISDARGQAQKMASAAGLSIGAVVAVSGASVVTPPSGAFSAGTYQPSCSLTVKFALTGL